MKFGTDIWNVIRKNPFVGGPNAIGYPLFLPHFTPKWHLHDAFLMGVLEHFFDVVYGPIIAVHSSNDVAPPNIKRGQKEL